jgi:integrase
MSGRFSRLDRLTIRKLRPGNSITEHGITVECLGDGDLRYSVNIMVDGKRVHRVIGRVSEGVTRTQAEEFIAQARTDARTGRLNLPNGRKLALTFGAAASKYLALLEEEGGKNLIAKRRHLRQLERRSASTEPHRRKIPKGYLIEFFGPMRLDSITQFAIKKYRKIRLNQGAAAGTVNRELATLSHLLSKAVEWRWLDRLPARPEKLAEPPGRIIALTDEQCDALMAAAIASADPDLWLFVAFGLNTAMRHSEIMAARWDQLDLAHRRLWVPDAKGGRAEQPITRELAELLVTERETRDDRDDWIFPSPHADSKRGHRVRMDRSFGEAVGRAGLDPVLVTPHVMRHTAITKLVQSGADLPTIQRISRHKTLAMVLRYAHVHGPHIDTAIRALGRTLPKLSMNETARLITPELHMRPRAPVQKGASEKPKLRTI